jgi:NADPH:quinone reductase-like Zn-dependent oxidoreductase
VDADAVLPVPAGVSLEAAAALPTAGVTAFQALRTSGALQAGERVLIDGASGGVGGFAIQLARALGAHVTAVVGPGKVEIALALGADCVIDYTHADPTNTERSDLARTEPPAYDLIYAANGHRNLSDYRRVLSPQGRFVMTGGSGSLMLQTMLAGGRYRFHTMKPRCEDLTVLLDFASVGTIRPNIVARYPLARAGEALTQLEQGHASGKIIISIVEGDTE